MAEATPGQVALAVHGFITHYFACNDCREHFLAAHSREEVLALPPTGNAVALWFWSAHNAVNSRLRLEDLNPKDGGEAMAPDAPWHLPFPTAHDCEGKVSGTLQQSRSLSPVSLSVSLSLSRCLAV